MRVKGRDPREIAATILERSICAVKVGCCIADRFGVHAWGANHAGPTGMGEHAEVHAMKRCNRNRMGESTLYVAAVRKRRHGNKIITAKPCESCQRVIKGIGKVVYRDGEGKWIELRT